MISFAIFSIDENNRLLIARQICLLIGETLRSFLFTIFFSNEFSRRGCSSAYLYEKSFGHPGMVDKPLCSIRHFSISYYVFLLYCPIAGAGANTVDAAAIVLTYNAGTWNGRQRWKMPSAAATGHGLFCLKLVAG